MPKTGRIAGRILGGVGKTFGGEEEKVSGLARLKIETTPDSWNAIFEKKRQGEGTNYEEGNSKRTGQFSLLKS